MRQITITIIILMNCHYIFGQTECKCEVHPNYNNFINCDSIIFKNDAKLYRQFNCDSSWLTFEGINKKEIILYSIDKELIDLTPRIGYQFVKEYSNLLLFKNRQASGGGFPINYELLDKNNGEVLFELGPILYYSNEGNKEYIVTLINDTLPKILLYDLKNNIESEYPILSIGNDVSKSILEDMFPENHFSNSLVNNDIFESEYSYKVPGNEKWLKTKISVDLLTIESHLSKDLNEIENLLDSIYSSLNEKLLLSDKATLTNSQEAWVKYRNSNCVFKSKKNSEGEIGYKMFLDCKIQETRLRINELTDILENGF